MRDRHKRSPEEIGRLRSKLEAALALTDEARDTASDRNGARCRPRGPVAGESRLAFRGCPAHISGNDYALRPNRLFGCREEQGTPSQCVEVRDLSRREIKPDRAFIEIGRGRDNGGVKDRAFTRRSRKSYPTSKLKSSSAPIRSKDSWCCPSAGSSSARLPGSIAVEGLPRIGKTSIARRSHSCVSPQSASCSENSAIPFDVFGQTLRMHA